MSLLGWGTEQIISHGGVWRLCSRATEGRLDRLLSTLCSLVFLQISWLRSCILALVASAGHGPGVSLRAGKRRFTRHLSTTLGLAEQTGRRLATPHFHPSSPQSQLVVLSTCSSCSILRLADSAHQRQAHWQQPPAPFAQNTEQLSCKQHLDSRCLLLLQVSLLGLPPDGSKMQPPSSASSPPTIQIGPVPMTG